MNNDVGSDDVMRPSPIAPSPEEKRALAEMRLPTAGEVAANVARLERRGAEHRRINQGEVATIEQTIADEQAVQEKLRAIRAKLDESRAVRNRPTHTTQSC